MSGLVNYGMDKGSMMESEDRIEKTVDIYITAEAVRDMKHKKDTEDFDTQTAKTQTPQHTGTDSVRNRSSRAAAVCLVLLCVLLLTAVIVLCVTFTQERQQFIFKNENLTNERNQLISKNENLTNERNQLRKHLQSYANWTCHQSRFYYISNEKKNWTESRRDCRERGADLIIINNREEQDFVKNMTGSAIVYIGLTDSDVENTWKWVDGSTLTTGFSFWASGDPKEPNGDRKENCVVTVAVPTRPDWGTRVGWLDVGCNIPFQWICEKSVSHCHRNITHLF